MSTIAKIFTVLNVILAAAFLGWAASTVSTANDFKGKLETEMSAHKITRDALGVEKSKLVADLTAANDTRNRLQQQLADAQADNERVANEQKSLNEKLNSIEADYKKMAGTLEGISTKADQAHANELKALTAQHEAETKMNEAVAARLAAEGKSSGLDNDLIAARDEISSKEKTLAQVEKDREKVKTELSTVVAATGYKLSDVQAMPQIEGKILATEMSVEPGMVSINRGEAAGVKRGFTFEIFDGGTYKGQARVESVHAEQCSAVLVRKVKGVTIRQGDGAATRL